MPCSASICRHRSNHRGYDVAQVIDQMYVGTEGIYGIPTYVSSSYIFLFIVFGAFLERAGMIKLFTDLALGTGGSHPGRAGEGGRDLVLGTDGNHQRQWGGQRGHHRPVHDPADEAVRLSSPPSPVRSRLPPAWVGRSCPRSWGRWPSSWPKPWACPISRSSRPRSFQRCSTILTVYWMVHLEAGRLGLDGLPQRGMPERAARHPRGLVSGAAAGWRWSTCCSHGYTPLFAGTVGLALTAVLILGTGVAREIGPTAIPRPAVARLGPGRRRLPALRHRGQSSCSSSCWWWLMRSAAAAGRHWRCAVTAWPRALAVRCRWASPAPWSA